MQATASPAIAGSEIRGALIRPEPRQRGVAMSVCTPIAIGTPPQVIAPSSSAIISA